MQAQYSANQTNATLDEVLEIAFTVALNSGADQDVVICSTYIAATELGIWGETAVDRAIAIAVKYGLNENKAKVAAELGAKRYQSSYEIRYLGDSSEYNRIDCEADYSSSTDFYYQNLK